MKSRLSLLGLLGELGRVPPAVENPDAEESLRDTTLARMKRAQREALRERTRAARRSRIWLAVAAAVFGLATVVLSLHLWRDDVAEQATHVQARLRALNGLVEVSHEGRTLIVGADTRPLSAGDRVQTHAGALANVYLPSGATFSAGERASFQVSLPEPGMENVQLGLGRVDVHVPKLAKGQGFVVRSADTVVTVRGTRFAVAVQELPASKLATIVEVSEGVVAVQSRGKTVELRAGEHWSSDEAAPGSAALAPAETAPVVAVKSSSPVAPSSTDNGVHRETSSLASENELLAQAMSAAASGDDGRALALLGAFLTQHPKSPLAENAAIERLRVLARSGNGAAASRAARRYLAQYPEGIGRDLARRLATDSTGTTDSRSP